MVTEASSTLFPIAKDVKIQIEFNPEKVAEYRLIGYETRMLKREDFNNDKVDAGDIGSGHTVTAIYEIVPPGSPARLNDEPRYSANKKKTGSSQSQGEEYAFLKIRYKLPNSDKSTLMTTPITVKEEFKKSSAVPGEVRFAAAVAAYAQILRQDPYTGSFTLDKVIELASSALGPDQFGYRHEFLNLVRLTQSAQTLTPQ